MLNDGAKTVKVSVILPCYNAAPLLSKSLDSILKQTLTDIEVICVDDGSTDETLMILKTYADTDARVKILEQKNQYAGVARNNGMAVSRGKYLYFMDSDDFLVNSALEKIYLQSEETGADICLFGAGTLNLATGEEVYTYPLKERIPLERPFSKKELSASLIGAHHTAPWNRLYRKSFVKKSELKFQPLARSNDFFFCMATMIEADTITVVNECLYFRTINSGTSLVETMDHNPYGFYEANKKLREYLLEKDLFDEFKRTLILYHMVSARHVLSKLKNPEILSEVVLFLKNTYFEELEIWKYRDVLRDQRSHLNLLTYIVESDADEFAKILYNPETKMIEQLIKISIVIPCYNSQCFLADCLDSLLKQTLKEFEIICVDDGSTDDTFEILTAYAQKDARITVLKQHNQYAGIARNHGMSHAKGKYLLFLDSDDFFEPMMLEKMYLKAEEHLADICITSGGKYDLRTRLVSHEYETRYDRLPRNLPFSRIDAQKDIFSLGYGAPWNKLFKRNFIRKNGLEFQGIRSSNDIFFVQSAMAIAERITVVDGWFFNYRVGSKTSLVETIEQSPLCFYESYVALKTFLLERSIYNELRLAFKKAALGSGLYALRMAKTNASWLKIALFLKHTYLPELELLEVKDMIPYSHKEELAVILDQNEQVLSFYEPVLRKSEIRNFELDDQLCLQSSSKNVKVSVVVEPAISTSRLRECLISLQNQTLKDFEVICMTDFQQDELESIIEKDERFLFLSAEGKTASTINNEAIQIAKGEYILFLNGNDVILQVALAHLYLQAKKQQLDDLLFEGILVYDSMNLYRKHRNQNIYRYYGEYENSAQKGTAILELLTTENELKLTHNMHLFRVDFLKKYHLTFDEKVPMDYLFFIKALRMANRALIHQEPLYVKHIIQESFDLQSAMLEGLNKALQDCENSNTTRELNENLLSHLQLIKRNMLSDMINHNSQMSIVKFERKNTHTITIGLELKIFQDVMIDFSHVMLKLRNNTQNFEHHLAITKVDQLADAVYVVEFDFNVTSLKYVPLYYDLYLVIKLDGNTHEIIIKNPTEQVKKQIYLRVKKYETYLSDGYKIYPHLLEGRYLSFTYRQPEEAETSFNRFKEQVAYFWYLLFKGYYDKKAIWLGFEKNAETASDNGFAFFKYCYENEKYEHFYYVLKKNSNEIDKFDKMKDRLLIHMSFKYMVYLYASKLLVASESKQHVYNIRAQKGRIQNILNKKNLVFLQHGVIAFKKVPFFKVTNQSARPKVFEVASNFEKAIVQKHLGYQDHEIMVTGLCRWDHLVDQQEMLSKKKIFVMPTWRDWLDSAPREDFVKTHYYQTYKKLLDDEALSKLLVENELELHFLLHPKFKEYSKEFSSSHRSIYVHTFGEVDVAKMLMECSMLVTDYSSIAWDMYYMGKPIIFYQFDLKAYQSYQGAYIDLVNDVFGDTISTHEELINELVGYIEADFAEKEQFKERRFTYFDHVDKNNSARTFEFINMRKEELYSSDKETLFKIVKRNLKVK